MLFVSSFHFIITGIFLKLNSVTRFKAASLNLILGILIFASIALEVISGTRAKSSWNFLSKLLNCFFLFFLCILIISLVISNFLFLPSVIIPNVDISIVGFLEGFNLDGVIFDEREILIIGSIRSLLGTISLNLDGIMLVSLLGLRLGSLLGLRLESLDDFIEGSLLGINREGFKRKIFISEGSNPPFIFFILNIFVSEGIAINLSISNSDFDFFGKTILIVLNSFSVIINPPSLPFFPLITGRGKGVVIIKGLSSNASLAILDSPTFNVFIVNSGKAFSNLEISFSNFLCFICLICFKIGILVFFNLNFDVSTNALEACSDNLVICVSPNFNGFSLSINPILLSNDCISNAFSEPLIETAPPLLIGINPFSNASVTNCFINC